MEKLELKHLAPYLPFKLMGINEKRSTFFYLDIFQNMLGKGIENRTIDVWLSSQIKPILRPLSDLTKEIEHNGEKFVPIEKLNIPIGLAIMLNYDNILNMPYRAVKQLLEYHFDIHGLIDKRLAIDINTLEL